MSVVAHRKVPGALAVALIVGLAFASQGAIAQDPASGIARTIRHERAQAWLEASTQGLPYMPGEALVKFHPGLQPAQHARALSVLRGAVPESRQRWIGDWLLVHATDEADAERMAARLAEQPEVVYAHPNYLSHVQTTPNDQFYSRQWNFDLIDMPRAWDINAGGSADVTVAVIDGGVTTVNRNFTFRLWTGSAFSLFSVPVAVNPDLDANQIAPGRDFVFGESVVDTDGHGTHVAGTILQATNNSIGLAGIAYRSRLLPVKACFGHWDIRAALGAQGVPGFIPLDENGGCEAADVVAGIRYAVDSGAKVLNVSLGGSVPVAAYRDALNYAVSRGAFVAVAAGNNFERGNPTDYPAAYAADIPGVMSVGAVGPTSRHAYYSNTGAYVEIAAPGGDDTLGGTSGVVWQAAPSPADMHPALTAPRFDRYVAVPKQGTSMAAPHVAGLAALLYSQGITSPAAIEAAIKQFARDLGPAGRDNEYGYGLIDARATLRGLGIAR